jgi:hypothetical protein
VQHFKLHGSKRRTNKRTFVEVAGDERYWKEEMAFYIRELNCLDVRSCDPSHQVIVEMWDAGYKDRQIALCIDVSKEI